MPGVLQAMVSARSGDPCREGLLGHLWQEENQFLIGPPDVARPLSPELRALIGYKVGSPYLGYVLEPELRDLFVDWERSIEKSYEVTEEIEQRIHEDKEISQ